MKEVDLVVIGGGPAGMAAALEAFKHGVKKILIIERDTRLGGILPQCIHNGFGIHVFGEELTGPEYALRFISQIQSLGIEYKLDTMVLSISKEKIITAVNSEDGLIQLKARAIILAMGFRERTRGALNIPGMRPAGILTAGTAQRFVNIEGYIPGRKVVILGSGDIGLIMARRLTLEGAEVKMVCELLPYLGGLTRNIVQCLEDYGIPLRLKHTVVEIHGKERLEGVTVAKVDDNMKPIPLTKEFVECDTLLLSVGLLPENELSREAGVLMDPPTNSPVVNESMETSIAGIFACGNVVHVHDIVDYVTQESRLAGKSAAHFNLSQSGDEAKECIKTVAGEGIRYIVPQLLKKERLMVDSKLFFRVTAIFKNVRISVLYNGRAISSEIKLKVTPGEMECLKITPGILEEIGETGELAIQLENAH